MFEFLFKRQGDKTDKARVAPAPAAAAVAPTSGRGSAAGREQQAQQLKALGADETLAVEFILQCEFSELRLAAAEHVHSQAALERVHAAMRNLDRRVAKLMHARLDALRHHEAELARGDTTLALAEALLADAHLTPNQVADLDRKWAVIQAPELVERYTPLRAQLSARLEAQVQLQRAMIDRLNSLRQLATSEQDANEIGARLAQMAQEQATALAAFEQPSLPRSLITEFAAEHARASAALAGLAQAQAACAARAAALDEWQTQPVAELKAEQLRQAWRGMPALPQNDAATELQSRFDALLASLPQPQRKPAPAPAPAPSADGEAAPARAAAPNKGADQSFIDAMDALEAALQQGSLGSAAELDKTLKDSKAKGMRLTSAQADRLTHLRAELKRLSDWARWGGNVSREELIKAVETLATQSLPMAELAKKVGSMRERWKALDSLSGAAPKSLWERFDQACSTAYAPAAAHFKQLAEERHVNAARGEALVLEAQAEIAKLASGEADWKHVAGTVQRLRLAWSHLGAIDRKDKKRLDQAFGAALSTLQAPLEAQRKAEVTGREELIDAVNAIDPHDRHAVERLREIQARWQEHARALPLERKAEQALWQRFRAACDDLFARRKDSAHAADVQRRAHEAAKEAISARLEQAALEVNPANAGKLLREAAAEWHAIGPVPRAHEARVEQRYHAAVAQVQQQVDQARRSAGLAIAQAVNAKLQFCQQLEAVLATPTDTIDAAAWRSRWDALASAGAAYDLPLAARFEAALAASGDGRAAYVVQLEQQRPALLAEVLRQEVAAGIDSGTEFARERLKLQVEALQSSLQAGAKAGQRQAAAVPALCALAALADPATNARIAQLVLHSAGEAR